ncbi:MAG: hypothetical protein IPK70_06635 [Flavobacteriales bacterium]|nr:hypothetical protein [Flavobacteriales bacterium]
MQDDCNYKWLVIIICLIVAIYGVWLSIRDQKANERRRQNVPPQEGGVSKTGFTFKFSLGPTLIVLGIGGAFCALFFLKDCSPGNRTYRFCVEPFDMAGKVLQPATVSIREKGNPETRLIPGLHGRYCTSLDMGASIELKVGHANCIPTGWLPFHVQSDTSFRVQVTCLQDTLLNNSTGDTTHALTVDPTTNTPAQPEVVVTPSIPIDRYDTLATELVDPNTPVSYGTSILDFSLSPSYFASGDTVKILFSGSFLTDFDNCVNVSDGSLCSSKDYRGYKNYGWRCISGRIAIDGLRRTDTLTFRTDPPDTKRVPSAPDRISTWSGKYAFPKGPPPVVRFRVYYDTEAICSGGSHRCTTVVQKATMTILKRRRH